MGAPLLGRWLGVCAGLIAAGAPLPQNGQFVVLCRSPALGAMEGRRKADRGGVGAGLIAAGAPLLHGIQVKGLRSTLINVSPLLKRPMLSANVS